MHLGRKPLLRERLTRIPETVQAIVLLSYAEMGVVVKGARL